MNLKYIKDNFGFKLLTKEENLNKEISELMCCDLLSWVMANGKSGMAWITVQVHNNILAVASLLEFSCIILPNGIEAKDIIDKANEENIAIFTTELNSYEIFKKFYEAGLK